MLTETLGNSIGNRTGNRLGKKNGNKLGNCVIICNDRLGNTLGRPNLTSLVGEYVGHYVTLGDKTGNKHWLARVTKSGYP